MAERTAEEKAQAQREAEAARADRAREKAAGEEPTYPVERLTGSEATALTGHPAPTVVAALALAGGTKKNFTRAEISDAIDQYLARATEVDPREER